MNIEFKDSFYHQMELQAKHFILYCNHIVMGHQLLKASLFLLLSMLASGNMILR